MYDYNRILIHPNPLLLAPCLPVDRDFVQSGEFTRLIAAMHRHLALQKNGVGIAANQIGGDRRVIVIALGRGEEYTMINPSIVKQSGQVWCTEQCLSVRAGGALTPFRVLRPKKLRVCFQEPHMEVRTINASGLLAQCIAHEVDHLNGITIVERGKRKAA